MKERLQKLISAAGLCSRRQAEEWIARGKVTVNGGLARLGDTADPETDVILIDGKPLPAAPQQTTTVLLYKPRGYVTTLSDEKGRRTVAELLPPALGRLYPVGRLDQFSEGLLLMTNDGALANRLTHPSGEASKTYRLWVSGWHAGALEKLRRPIVLDGRPIAPPAVRLLWAREGDRQQATGKAFPLGGRRHRASPASPMTDEGTFRQADVSDQPAASNNVPSSASHGSAPSAPDRPAADFGVPSSASHGSAPSAPDQPAASNNVPSSASHGSAPSPRGEGIGATAALEITIHEGRNRQIRRMAEAAGLRVTRLKRVAEGDLSLGDMKPGEWRRLTEAELQQLRTEN